MSEHVLTSVVVEIGAPAAFVWDVLVDHRNYPQWNPFIIWVATTLAIGDPVELTLPVPDSSGETFVNRAYVRVVDPPHHLRYDTGDDLPGVFTVRDQWILPRGPESCTYHTTDTLSGTYAHRVLTTSGAWVKNGLDALAHALKARVEELWAQ
ncbi:MAG TPA: SRPBCC domain-containing protein [Actinophytocola sp.]|nr:SRPBCC domain-containing protein [Actinophytocola sp.]